MRYRIYTSITVRSVHDISSAKISDKMMKALKDCDSEDLFENTVKKAIEGMFIPGGKVETEEFKVEEIREIGKVCNSVDVGHKRFELMQLDDKTVQILYTPDTRVPDTPPQVLRSSKGGISQTKMMFEGIVTVAELLEKEK